MSIVRGHGLRYEGAPHDGRGNRIAMGYFALAAGVGRAKCECGAMSDVLPSGQQRKQWHRDHKAQIEQAQR